MSEIRFRTLRCLRTDVNGWKRVIGVITVATIPDKIPGLMRVGIAYSQAKHFVRKKGQIIARNRLLYSNRETAYKHEGETYKDAIIKRSLDKKISFVKNADIIV